ncbi:hypothetical protein ACVWW2_000667 [Bradyrhizobium sp. LM4.3]
MRAARGDADALVDDVKHVANAADRLKVGFERAEQLVLQVAVIGFGQLAAELGLDLEIGLPRRAAEKALEYLIRGNWITVPGQHIRMRATGDHLAVHEHAVAIEDDEIDRHLTCGFVVVERDAIEFEPMIDQLVTELAGDLRLELLDFLGGELDHPLPSRRLMRWS